VAKIALVLAAGDNNVIGLNNAMPAWDLKDDMARFRTITSSGPVVMGRKTYDSIGRPLPRRRNIVITRQAGLILPGCDVVTSLDAALALAKTENTAEIFIIGGAQIYQQALSQADTIYLTRVHTTPSGDAHFQFDPSQWRVDWREEHAKDERNDNAFTYLNLSRI
jgi:dihydrofolate reductase